MTQPMMATSLQKQTPASETLFAANEIGNCCHGNGVNHNCGERRDECDHRWQQDCNLLRPIKRHDVFGYRIGCLFRKARPQTRDTAHLFLAGNVKRGPRVRSRQSQQVLTAYIACPCPSQHLKSGLGLCWILEPEIGSIHLTQQVSQFVLFRFQILTNVPIERRLNRHPFNYAQTAPFETGHFMRIVR